MDRFIFVVVCLLVGWLVKLLYPGVGAVIDEEKVGHLKANKVRQHSG